MIQKKDLRLSESNDGTFERKNVISKWDVFE